MGVCEPGSKSLSSINTENLVTGTQTGVIVTRRDQSINIPGCLCFVDLETHAIPFIYMFMV